MAKKIFHYIKTFISALISSIMWIAGTFASLFKMLFAVLTGGLILCVIAAVVIFIMIKPDVDACLDEAYDIVSSIQDGDFMRGQDTYIYDSEGNTIGIINAGHFEYVEIEDISPYIQDLYISQEDKRFKKHNGVDWIALARAGLALFKNGGDITQGGSTITQQLVKNTYLSSDQTFTRKLTEILVAPQLEAKYSKPKIMEFYCNSNYYGNRCYGVEAASEYYFGKDASDVTIAEAALLVALSNSPSSYDPVAHPEEALKKRNEVIENAVKGGFLTEEEGKNAKEESLVIVQQAFPENMETYESTYAVHCAAIALMEKEGFKFKYTFADKEEYDAYNEAYDALYAEKTEEIRNGGYSIYTSFVPEIQNALQKAIDDTLIFSTEVQENGKYALQGAGVIVDNTTGYVVAIVGGRGTEDQYNRAYLSARQPGSSIKPLIDYTPAFDTGEYYPGKIMNDHKFDGGPSNSGGTYYGNVTIRDAVRHSLNTVAWQVLEDIGVDTGLSYLDAMKFQKLTYLDNDVIALSIGGFTNGVRVVDMAKGYQTLANGGVYDNKTCITAIYDAGGNLVIDGEKAGTEKIYDSDSAYMMTDVLKGTFDGGTASGLDLSDMPAAGKTGTTNSSRDTWFCGYTRYYSMSVWVGYDTPRAMPGVYGSTYAGKIWQKVMKEIHEGLEPLDWECPDSVTLKEINGITDLYSSHADEEAQRSYIKRQEELYTSDVEKKLKAYEKTTLSSVEEIEEMETAYAEIRGYIVDVPDETTRKEMYERAETKYASLCEIRDGMLSDIDYYLAQKEIEDAEEQKRAEEEAEKAREKQIIETRYNDFERDLKVFKDLEYYPEDEIEAMIENLNEKLDALSGTSYYTVCASELQRAMLSAEYLSSYEEWLIEEAERQRKEAKEAERERQAEEMAKEAAIQAENALLDSAETDGTDDNGEAVSQETLTPSAVNGTGPGFEVTEEESMSPDMKNRDIITD